LSVECDAWSCLTFFPARTKWANWTGKISFCEKGSWKIRHFFLKGFRSRSHVVVFKRPWCSQNLNWCSRLARVHSYTKSAHRLDWHHVFQDLRCFFCRFEGADRGQFSPLCWKITPCVGALWAKKKRLQRTAEFGRGAWISFNSRQKCWGVN
jgi:hypothetical protein